MLSKKLYGFACIALSLCVACSSQSPNFDDGQQRTALPEIGVVGESYECEGPRPNDAPSLEAWLAAATAVVVGTIDEVVLVDDEFVLTKYDPSSQLLYYDLGEEDDCNEDSNINRVIDIRLSNIETLHGHDFGDEVLVRIRHKDFGFWDVYYEVDEDETIRWLRYPEYLDGLFEPGSTIGGALFQDPVTGFVSFEFRLFEVLDDIVYLQPYSARMEAELANEEGCQFDWVRSLLLDSAYHGMDLTDFQDVIEAADVDIDSLRMTNETLDNFLQRRIDEAEDQGVISYYQYLSKCSAYDVADLGGNDETE